VRLVALVRNHVDALVHPSARDDAIVAAHHRAFIAPRLIGGIAALAALPIYLTFRGVPGPLEFAVFGWMVVPILLAYFVSRTGGLETAHILSSLALAVLVTVIAACTGGIASVAAAWLIVVPLEAALSLSRRALAVAMLAAIAAAGLLLCLGNAGVLPDVAGSDQSAVMALVAAALYAGAVAFGMQWLSGAGASLRETEAERYRLVAAHVADVVVHHRRNGAVVFASPGIEPLLGVGARDLFDRGLLDRVQVADRPAYLTALADAAESGSERCIELRVRRGPILQEAGEPAFVWIEMRCQPLAERGGDVVAVLRDISARRAQDETLARLQRDLDQAAAGKNRFMATMSHELRTPLNAIIGFSDMLLQADDLRIDVQQCRDYARLINESGTHLLSVVNGILDISRMETGNFEIEPEPFSPAPVIAGCCDILRLKARETGIDIGLRLPAALPTIVADKRALNQILINLISNAVKFSHRGGGISVSALHDGASLVVAVEDNGVGIGEDDLLRVGEAFFQARASYDRRHGGAGLGLSIVKSLVKLHGGELEIRSRIGEGTRVSVRLPLDCECEPHVTHHATHHAAHHVAARLPLPDVADERDGMPGGGMVTRIQVKKRA
jgi:cell cycle sensor histidine kinase DivJ